MFGIETHKVPAGRIERLREIPMFAHYSDAELARVDALVYETTLPAGARLAVEGQVRRQAFILLEGRAVVEVADSEIARVGFGDVIGELSLLGNRPQNASVTALTPVRVLVMDPREFSTLISDPRAACWLAGEMSERLHEAQVRAAATRGRRHAAPAVMPVHVPA
jgi:CRP-like cAMP-binding protein